MSDVPPHGGDKKRGLRRSDRSKEKADEARGVQFLGEFFLTLACESLVVARNAVKQLRREGGLNRVRRDAPAFLAVLIESLSTMTKP